jgi:hypothetical protein
VKNLGDAVASAPDPSRTAVIDLADPATPRAWSFGDLDRAAAAVARGLLALGGKRGDRVAILAANRAEYLSVFLGAMRAGLVAVPVNLKLPAAAIEHIVRDAGVSTIFVDAEGRSAAPAGPAVVDGYYVTGDVMRRDGEGFYSLWGAPTTCSCAAARTSTRARWRRCWSAIRISGKPAWCPCGTR